MNRIEKIAKIITSFDENWEKGYSIGTDVAFKVRWSIGDVIQIAAYIGEKSGVPELVRAAASIKRSEDKEIVEGVTFKAAIAQRIINKVKRYGVMGMAGAMAGMTEDANAHSAAGIVYALGDTLMAKYGMKIASDIVADNAWVMETAKPKFYTMFEKFNGLRWSLRDYGAFEHNVAEKFWQIMKRAAKKMSFPNMRPEDWGLDMGMKKWPLAAQRLTEAAKNIFGQLRSAPEEELQQIAQYYGEERLAKIAAGIWNEVELNEITEMGGWSLSPKFVSKDFILTKEGLYVRGAYGSETYRPIPIRHAVMELGLRDAPELVLHAFEYFTGSYMILLDRLIKSGEYHAKKLL